MFFIKKCKINSLSYKKWELFNFLGVTFAVQSDSPLSRSANRSFIYSRNVYWAPAMCLEKDTMLGVEGLCSRRETHSLATSRSAQCSAVKVFTQRHGEGRKQTFGKLWWWVVSEIRVWRKCPRESDLSARWCFIDENDFIKQRNKGRSLWTVISQCWEEPKWQGLNTALQACGPENAATATCGSLLDVQNLRPYPGLLNQGLHLPRSPRKLQAPYKLRSTRVNGGMMVWEQ